MKRQKEEDGHAGPVGIICVYCDCDGPAGAAGRMGMKNAKKMPLDNDDPPLL